MKRALTLVLAQLVLAGVGAARAQSAQPSENLPPPLSLTIRAVKDVVQAGSPVEVEVTATNVSDHRAIYLISGHTAFDVRDSAGDEPLTKRGRALLLGEGLSFDDFPKGSIPEAPELIEPGKSITVKERVPTDIFDLTKPDSYTIQLRLPWGQDRMKSNTVTVKVVQGATPYLAPVPQPPIAVTIEPVGGATVFPGGQVVIEVITKNISKYPTNERTADDKRDLQRFFRVDVQDSQGATPPETDFGISVGNRDDVPPHFMPWNPTTRRGDPLVPSYFPGDERSEVIAVNDLYDLSKPGEYTIQVRRWDDETKTWVKSNTLTVAVTP
jgi:hypothetical protein